LLFCRCNAEFGEVDVDGLSIHYNSVPPGNFLKIIACQPRLA
jgi:hypothetical protein